jgi:hypothetical protein
VVRPRSRRRARHPSVEFNGVVREGHGVFARAPSTATARRATTRTATTESRRSTAESRSNPTGRPVRRLRSSPAGERSEPGDTSKPSSATTAVAISNQQSLRTSDQAAPANVKDEPAGRGAQPEPLRRALLRGSGASLTSPMSSNRTLGCSTALLRSWLGGRGAPYRPGAGRRGSVSRGPEVAPARHRGR